MELRIDLRADVSSASLPGDAGVAGVLSADQYGPVGFVTQIQSVKINALEMPLDIREEPSATHPIFSHARTIPARLATRGPYECAGIGNPTRKNAMDLKGKAVIVTGSSSGIGEAVARRLSALGAGIVVNSQSSIDAGTRLASELVDAVYVRGDIGDPSTAGALVGAARERWGRLDGLVNNAGRTVPVPLHDIGAVTPEHWDQVLRTNVIGSFLVAQAALPLLRDAGDGWIVNIGSIAGIRQVGSSLPYAVSKAALHHLTTLLAKYAGGNVRVNAVAPGLVDTPWTETWNLQREFVGAAAPLHRIATPDDVAEACLAFVANGYATGQVLVVDGGFTLVS
jgi:ketoreductase RED2